MLPHFFKQYSEKALYKLTDGGGRSLRINKLLILFASMKRITTITLVLLLFIGSEYFLLQEALTEQRTSILSISLIAFILSTIFIIRFFRKSTDETNS